MFWMIRLLGRRVSRATEQMTDGLELPAPVRLAKALLELAALHSRLGEEGLEISLPMSQRELGGMTGLIRESINKHLGSLREAGWLSQSGRTITLRNVAALRARCGTRADMGASGGAVVRFAHCSRAAGGVIARSCLGLDQCRMAIRRERGRSRGCGDARRQ
jgi:hypothetical protein